MKKITFCITNDYLYDRRIQRCVEALSTVYSVEVICRNIHKNENYNNVKITKVKSWFKTGLMFYAIYNLKLMFILWRRKTDFIVAVDYDTIIGAFFGGKVNGAKLIFDAHEYYEESIEIVERLRIQKFWKWLGKTFVPKAHAAYTVSNTIAKTYSALHKIPFETIRNVPYYQLKTHKKQLGKKIILYQGAINKGRKLELLIDSAKYLKDDFEIWIIGEGDLSEALRIQANEKVIFHSWVHPDKLYELTQEATLAYNLLDATSKSYYYSLANKFFDYIQAGVPSLNSPFPEYIQLNDRYNCCFITDVTDSKELSEMITELANNKILLAEKSKNARLAALDLCWENESEKLLKIFNNL